jgi:hypothetical protein
MQETQAIRRRLNQKVVFHGVTHRLVAGYGNDRAWMFPLEKTQDYTVVCGSVLVFIVRRASVSTMNDSFQK